MISLLYEHLGGHGCLLQPMATLSEEALYQLCQISNCTVKGVEHAEHWVHQVVVTTGQLIPTLAKLLICGLDAYLPAEGIYSARDETKDHCFRLIEDSHGPHTKYCVIGERDIAP